MRAFQRISLRASSPIGARGNAHGTSALTPGGKPWTCTRCLLTTRARSLRIPAAPIPQTHALPLLRKPIPTFAAQRYSVSTATTTTTPTPGTTTPTASGFPPSPPPPRKRTKVLLSLAVAGAVVALLGYKAEDVTHGVKAVRRAGRVAVGLALCINDYRVTLNQVDAEPDPRKQQVLLEACHQRCANRTYSVLERNGSIFIKLGQHLAAMGYLLPKEWTSTFVPLQDKCPVSSYESIREMVLKDTGFTIEELFEEFDPVPIGAASLAQVHRARLKGTGEEVAVKLQHPSLEEWIPLDIALTRFTFTNIKHFFPHYPLSWLSEEMEASLPNELDFTHEARNIKLVHDHFSQLPRDTYPLVVPTVKWAKKRIIVMNYLPGRRLDDSEWLREKGIDPGDVAAALAHVFDEMIFGRGVPLHCDPHAGNLAIREREGARGGRGGFEVILYDHGLYRMIPEGLRTSYARMWLAVLEGDVDELRRWSWEVVGGGEEGAAAAAAAAEDGEGKEKGWSEQRFRIFASAITGREFRVLTRKGGVASQARDDREREVMSSALAPVNAVPPPVGDGIPSAGEGETEGGMLAELMQLLASVPRVVLLILKTNDLTRSLEEMLLRGGGGTSHGERGFLILARYCARRVFLEQPFRDERGRFRLWWWVRAVWSLWRVEARLKVFEVLLAARRRGLLASV